MQLPLHDVVGRCPPLQLDIVWLLISKSPETIHARTTYGQSALHNALSIKTKCLIKLLLDTVDMQLLKQTADNGMTPLHLACWHQNDVIISSVLKKYVDAVRLVDNEISSLSFGMWPVSSLKTTFCIPW